MRPAKIWLSRLEACDRLNMGLLQLLVSHPFLTAAGAAATGAAAVYLYASRIEARSFRLETLEPVTISGAGTGSEKIKILHLSDLHLCEPESSKMHFLQNVDASEFDLVVITGDVFENPTGLQYAEHILKGKPKHGAFAVLGNHDYFPYSWLNKTYGRINRKYRHPKQKRDVQPFIDALSEQGIVTLRNEIRRIDELKVVVIGIDYPHTTEEKWRELRAQVPDGWLILALQHVPYKLKSISDAGVHLAFAGHTHGGQIRVPGFGALITDSELPRQEASGLVRRGDTMIHVSRGLSADPKTNFRLFCPPAATILSVSY